MVAQAASDALKGAVEAIDKACDKAGVPVGVVYGAAAVSAASVVGYAMLPILRKFAVVGNDNRTMNATSLSMGSIDKEKTKDAWDSYASNWTGDAAGDMEDKGQTVQMVDDFYSFVTDIYEWGWGQSFHFAPKLPGKSWEASEAAQEARLAALMRLKPGMKALDAGCGVGGPMRTIAGVSGAKITGITINEYQVQRCDHHNKRLGYGEQCDVVRGSFLEMPFENGSFDAVYAVEATCHAPVLEKVYKEIARVLKPGGVFVSQEWVSTEKYDDADEDHKRIIAEINFGNGLPDMRTWKQAEEAAVAAGFKIVQSYDMATSSPACGPWEGRLTQFRWLHHVDDLIVKLLTFLRVAPKGLKEVHEMLVNVAVSLIQGGESGVFSPMHLLVCEKK